MLEPIQTEVPPTGNWGRLRARLKDAERWLAIPFTGAVLLIAGCFFFYPAAVTLGTVYDIELRTLGQTASLQRWFERTAGAYEDWAQDYLAARRGGAVNTDDVAATEWPIFVSVFLVLTAEALYGQPPSRGPAPLEHRALLKRDVKHALERAAEVIAHPSTATWVRNKWGAGYLERENVFYRMLLVLGLGSYARLTGDTQYHGLIAHQAESLGSELDAAPHHLADDYPGECYPTDVLWAVAAINRVSDTNPALRERLTAGVLGTLNGPAKTAHSLPAFRVIARSSHRLHC